MEKCNHDFKFMETGYICTLCGMDLEKIVKDGHAGNIMAILENYIGLPKEQWTQDIKEHDIYPMIDYIGNICRAAGEAEKGD